MSTDVDGAAPSAAPGPDDDAGPGWLQQEIRRRAARAGSSSGRHARRGGTDTSPTAHEYVPRHGGGPPPPAGRELPPPRPPAAHPSTRDDPWSRPGEPGPGAAARPGVRGPAALPPPRSAAPTRPVAGAPLLRPGPAPAGDAAAPPTTPLTITPPAVPRTSETLPGLPSLTPVSDPAIAGSYPGMPAVTPRAVPLPGPAAATLGGLGTPSRPDLAPRKRTRPDPPSGAAAARLLGLADAPPAPPQKARPAAADSPVDLRGQPDVDPDADDESGLLDEDLAADGEDRILWSAAGPPPAVPEQRTSDATDDVDEPGPPRGARFPRQDDAGPQRVRVVLSERKGVTRPVRNVVELQESGAVGDLLRSNLIGSQLGVALRFALLGGLVLGLLPLLFAMVPWVGRLEVLGFRVPWLVLGLAVYPFLFGLGWWFTRVAEKVEQTFADQVQD